MTGENDVKTIRCNVLFKGMGNVVVDVMAPSYDAILVQLHAEDENDRYLDGFQNALPIRVYRDGIAAIGPQSPITQVRPSILRPVGST